VLALDRPFTYELDPELGAALGSLVRVRFHGKLTRGWVLGPTDDVPGRILPVMRLVSPVPAFDERLLALARWISERYVVPLAAVLGRLAPPRVAGEEVELPEAGPATRGGARRATADGEQADEAAQQRAMRGVLTGYRGADRLLGALRGEADEGFVVRAAPGDEAAVAVEAVAACLAGGRRAIVVVPEASPMPATATAILEAFGERACSFVGGDRRGRYRRWLEIRTGAFDVVVGTRPAVFAPVADLGAIVVMREGHPALREDRAPYTHVRDVALARARIEGATAMLVALSPSVESATLALPTVEPASRRWPPVEVVRPAPQGRAPRLLSALREARRGFLYAPVPGAGLAVRCRSCGAAAACASCGGALRLQDEQVSCVVCERAGSCASCGASSFGIRRGGAEAVESWAAREASARVRRISRPRLPEDGEVLVGGAEVVRDLGHAGLDLVGILDADLAERRPGLAARQRALSTWSEAASWAHPGGRVIVQSGRPTDAAIQALVRGNPDRFHADERERRAAAGFPVGAAVFRVEGGPGLGDELRAQEPISLLASSAEGRTVCLLALEERRVPAFGREMRARAARGEVTRVEAEPHL
jgi:primosomal protein N' (replication factor Y)